MLLANFFWFYSGFTLEFQINLCTSPLLDTGKIPSILFSPNKQINTAYFSFHLTNFKKNSTFILNYAVYVYSKLFWCPNHTTYIATNCGAQIQTSDPPKIRDS